MNPSDIRVESILRLGTANKHFEWETVWLHYSCHPCNLKFTQGGGWLGSQVGFGPGPSNLWLSSGDATLALNSNPPNINILAIIFFI
jgi:hypothetical protein